MKSAKSEEDCRIILCAVYGCRHRAKHHLEKSGKQLCDECNALNLAGELITITTRGGDESGDEEVTSEKTKILMKRSDWEEEQKKSF